MRIYHELQITSNGPKEKQEDLRNLYDIFPCRAALDDYTSVLNSLGPFSAVFPDGMFSIWSSAQLIDMEKGYQLVKNLGNVLPVGDNGGGRVLFIRPDKSNGVYIIGFGDLYLPSSEFIANSLTSLIELGEGLQSL